MSNTKKSRRTYHILKLFQFFYLCEQVSYGLIKELIPDLVCKRTIRRYISLLKDTGLIQLRYSKKERAYVPVNGSFVPKDGQFSPAKLPDKRPQSLYMEKIIRLCTLITEVVIQAEEDPVAWYHERYPELSERTRQRDFEQLREVGYDIRYFPGDKWDPARYYYMYDHDLF